MSEGTVERSNLSLLYERRLKEAKELFDVEEYTRSDVICRELLMNADLPVLYKAGAHLLLAGGGDNELYHARQARDLYQMMAELEPDDARHQDLLALSQDVLAGVEEDLREEASKGREVEGDVTKDQQSEAEEDSGLKKGSLKRTAPSLDDEEAKPAKSESQ